MRTLLTYSSLLFCLKSIVAVGQDSPPISLKIMAWEWQGNEIHIKYNIPPDKYQNGDWFCIEVEGNAALPLDMKTLSGDVGRVIAKAGQNYKIRWNFAKDLNDPEEIRKFKEITDLYFMVKAQKLEKPNIGKAMLRSALLPHLGHVQLSNGKTKAPYWLSTGVIYGLAGAGMVCKLLSKNAYDKHRTESEDLNGDSQKSNDYYQKANSLHHAYYAMTASAAALWTINELWVLQKGLKKKRNYLKNCQNAASIGLGIAPLGDVWAAHLTVHF